MKDLTELRDWLAGRSKEICRDNACTDEEHKCESYAYITADGHLLDICTSDYFQGSSKPHAAVSLPWDGTAEELREEIEEQTYDSTAAA
jgi:hypothetical protein